MPSTPLPRTAVHLVRTRSLDPPLKTKRSVSSNSPHPSAGGENLEIQAENRERWTSSISPARTARRAARLPPEANEDVSDPPRIKGGTPPISDLVIRSANAVISASH